MSEEGIWEELRAAGYMRTPECERTEQQRQPERHDTPRPSRPPNADDEMAATAGHLLESVADNTSEKFQNSQFLGLMRRLRDREVRVDDDKIIEVSDSARTESASREPILQKLPSEAQSRQQQHQAESIPTQIPPIDPTILDHAATMPSVVEYPETLDTPNTREAWARHGPEGTSAEQSWDEDRWKSGLAAAMFDQ